MAIATVILPSSLAACVGAWYCSGCAVLMGAQGEEGEWRGRRPMRAAGASGFGDANDGEYFAREAINQVTIRTAPEATPPRRGEDDGLRQAPSLVPSCSPSPCCCGTWDDDDAAASDPDPDDPEYYPVGNHIQFGHVENYFNELNEFDQLFAHDDQLICSHLVFLALPTRLLQFQHLTKPSSTTGNSVTSVDSAIMPMRGGNVRDEGDRTGRRAATTDSAHLQAQSRNSKLLCEDGELRQRRYFVRVWGSGSGSAMSEP
ncbi:hypothetical protein EDB83DRAFT_2315989 [Lactarius deliciosus]|nr:hypothetical protein EDB83DRAFT_2315989 [Lactarius deliciosus]